MTSRKEVAKLAGVSVAVVSYVLNGKSNVKEETRQRVLAAIKELRYEPNHLARSLKIRSTNQLAVFVNNLGNPFEAGILLHLETAARERQYLIFYQSYTKELEPRLISGVNGRVDGIILLGQSLTEESYGRLQQFDIPVLSITRSAVPLPAHVPVIDLDWISAYRSTIRHLREQGHRNIGFMTDEDTPVYHANRLSAFKLAMIEEGLPSDAIPLLNGGGRTETAKAAFLHYADSLHGKLPFTALVCSNDLMAAGVANAALTHRIGLPERLAVHGSENILLASLTAPSLSVIHYPREQLGELAMDMMVELLRTGQTESVTLNSSLLIRESG